MLLLLVTDVSEVATPGRVDVALLIGAMGLIAAAVAGWLGIQRRRRQQADLAELARQHGFSPVHDAGTLRAIQAAMDAIFGQGAVLLAAMHKQVHGLTLEVVHYRFPLYRVERTGEWDPHYQEADDRMITLVRKLDAPLPIFRLMPNNWVLNTIGGQRRNVFVNVEPFGWHNYVFGQDRDHVRYVFAGEIQHMLRQNKHLAIDSRGDLLAFYHLDEAWLPDDFDGFARRCLSIATALNQRGRAWADAAAPRVVHEVMGEA